MDVTSWLQTRRWVNLDTGNVWLHTQIIVSAVISWTASSNVICHPRIVWSWRICQKELRLMQQPTAHDHHDLNDRSLARSTEHIDQRGAKRRPGFFVCRMCRQPPHDRRVTSPR
jgi:hypothetical protein